MTNYNKIYSTADILDNIEPSHTVSLIWKNFLPNSKILDLGCGQGTDSLFLSKNGFSVTAIDSSEVAINQIKIKKDKFKLDNLELIGQNNRAEVILLILHSLVYKGSNSAPSFSKTRYFTFI